MPVAAGRGGADAVLVGVAAVIIILDGGEDDGVGGGALSDERPVHRDLVADIELQQDARRNGQLAPGGNGQVFLQHIRYIRDAGHRPQWQGVGTVVGLRRNAQAADRVVLIGVARECGRGGQRHTDGAFHRVLEEIVLHDRR